MNSTFNITATINRQYPKLNLRKSDNPQVTTTTTTTNKPIKTIRFHEKNKEIPSN
jgi:hypothetical protein